MTEPRKYERKPWHYGPPLGFVVEFVIALLLLTWGDWGAGVACLLFAAAFAFQTWWIWVDIPRKWPYA